jgi:hypothetical protein
MSNFEAKNIRSIRWLHSTEGTINLTPIFKGESYPVFVNISREEFEKIRGNDELMKCKAIEILNNI